MNQNPLQVILLTEKHPYALGRTIFLLCVLCPLMLASLGVMAQSYPQDGKEMKKGEDAKEGETQVTVTEAEEKEPVVTLGGEVDFNSRFIWRGIALSEKLVLNPSVFVSAYNFTFTAWGNYVMLKEPDWGKLNEIDLILEYQYEIKGFTILPSVIFYLAPYAVKESTGELNLKLAYNIIAGLSVFTFHAVDIIDNAGGYFGNIGLEYEHEIIPEVGFLTSLSTGWASHKFNKYNIDVSETTMNVFDFYFELNLYPIEHLYLRVHFEVTTLLDKDLRNAVEDPTLIGGGVAIGTEWGF
jgi:hypothetical protein